MQFNQTTAECNDHLTVNRDGPGLGPVVAVCESCCPCGGTLEALWEKIAKRMEADHANR